SACPVDDHAGATLDDGCPVVRLNELGHIGLYARPRLLDREVTGLCWHIGARRGKTELTCSDGCIYGDLQGRLAERGRGVLDRVLAWLVIDDTAYASVMRAIDPIDRAAEPEPRVRRGRRHDLEDGPGPALTEGLFREEEIPVRIFYRPLEYRPD